MLSELDQEHQNPSAFSRHLGVCRASSDLQSARPFLCVKLLSDELAMPAIEKAKSLVVKAVAASQIVTQGRLTVLAWRSGLT